MPSASYVLDFSAISLKDVPLVGGKNASLGEMFNALTPLGIRALDGYATTIEAWRRYLEENDLRSRLDAALQDVDVGSISNLSKAGLAAREMILETPLPDDIAGAINQAYVRLAERIGREMAVAVRSSATAEDLPGASFAGQQETYLNVSPGTGLLEMVHRCFASLYTDRAISYRAGHGFKHSEVSISVGIQPMVRSDLGSAGVLFTLDPETGFRNVVSISGSWGLGESVVQGMVVPDEWLVFKTTLRSPFRPIIGRTKGLKSTRIVIDEDLGTRVEETPEEDRRRFSLTDDQVLQLAEWACEIERHYTELSGHEHPMDIEWGLDGVTGELYILQARPETVHASARPGATARRYRITGQHGAPLVSGQAVGEKVGIGPARIVQSTADLALVQDGDVLVAEMTNPDWEPVMRKVAGIVTDRGGRTAHAAIVSRELGLPCVVGTTHATSAIRTGQVVTVSCAEGSEGRVYDGEVAYWVDTVDLATLPHPRAKMMLTVADPSQAFSQAALPNDGVGLARMEFIVARHIGIHPMALVRYPDLNDPQAVADIAARIESEGPCEYFVRTLSEGIATIAAAFYPKPVIVRTSDFKTNEYARLIGGAEFEPDEENPMLGFRGASRYYDPRYSPGFALECEAIHRARRGMGLYNVKIMIPFCRTPEEGRRVIEEMRIHGLRQGEHQLEIWAMCELPSNVMEAEAFLEIFDGFSIGSNDLTQLILGIDRDSGSITHLFDERNPAVTRMISMAIAAARKMGKPIGICGQAPSDYPELAAWLIDEGISSISLNPDAVMKTALAVAGAGEKAL